MTGHAFDLGVVDPIGGKLVVRAHQLEHRGTAEDQIWFIGRANGWYGETYQGGKR
jgi:hypothetical protein